MEWKVSYFHIINVFLENNYGFKVRGKNKANAPEARLVDNS
jgi:hypothetical protein